MVVARIVVAARCNINININLRDSSEKEREEKLVSDRLQSPDDDGNDDARELS